MADTSAGRRALRISLPFALFTAIINIASLAATSGGARIRDLRVLRLARRLADQFDWNMLAAAPHWLHSERNLGSLADLTIFFASAAASSLLLLFPVALLLEIVMPRVSSRGSNARAASLAVLSVPTVILAAQLPFGSVVTAITVALAALLIYVLAAHSSEHRLSRLLTISSVASFYALTLAVAASPVLLRRSDPPQHQPLRDAPNILLISIDSLRADHLHSYGYPRRTSPNLDILADEGSRFDTVISPTSWTLPAHMTLLTFLPPEEHGVITNRFRLARGIDTLPQRLQRSGYSTAGFVSATYLDGLFGFGRGFDEYDDYSLLRVAAEKSRTAVTSRLVADRAVGWLRNQAASPTRRPFFLFLHFFDVHYDYNPPPPYARMFDEDYSGSATGDVNAIRTGMRPRDMRHVVALYDGEIAWVDANIGRILAALKTMGLDKNTIVAVTADHGEEFLDHGQAGHDKTLYDEVLRVPLIIRYPGHVAPGRKIEGQIRLMDVGPTLLKLAGLRTPRSPQATEAHSLACLLSPATAVRSTPLRPAFGDLNGEIASVRTADAKLIVDLRTKKEEFYDLAIDPLEHENRDQPGGPRVDELRAILDRWRATVMKHPGDAVDLDSEEKETLRSLGYL